MAKTNASKPVKVMLVAALCCAFVLSAMTPQAAAQEMQQATDQELVLRWDPQEKPHEDKNIAARGGSNVRDGLVGCVDSLCQGLFSTVAILSPWGGFTAKKVVTIVGDVVGLVDNNFATKYVFKGILSRQLLRFGAGNTAIVNGLAVIHDTEYDGPSLPLEAYVGEEYFHTQAYVTPSIFVMLGAVIASDIIIRPTGNLIMVFGARETGESMNNFGIKLVGSSTKPKFF